MKSNGTRRFIFSVFLIMLFVFGATPAFAAEEAIPSVQVNAVLQRDGSAVITEIWDVRGVSSGTEYYKALNNMEGMSVHSFQVKDEFGTPYKTLDSWDTKRSREQKANTSGILKTSDGYELCWGIGNYGNHQYTIQYVLDGLVKNYSDYAGFYHQFVSELSSNPQAVSVQIQAANTSLTERNARIWGYGYPGKVEISGSGNLTALSSEGLDSGDYVNILCRFDKSLFPQAATVDGSFERLQKSAENDNSNLGLYIVLAILAVGIVGSIGLISFFYSRYKLADGTTVKIPSQKQIEPTWSIPFGSSVPAVYSAMKLLRREIPCDKLLGAYLIRWQKAGYIHIEEREKTKNGKTAKKEEAIVFDTEKVPTQFVEQSLHNILLRVANPDGILWNSAIEKRAEKLYEELVMWAKEVESQGEKELTRLNVVAMDTNNKVRFTASGFDQTVRVLGLQKYLKETANPKKEEALPRELWGDYLVFAALFGVEEQVLKTLERIDPTYFNIFAGSYGFSTYHMLYFMTMTNHISSAATPNLSGTGGAAGSIGGGGFSGGGGGGSR